MSQRQEYQYSRPIHLQIDYNQGVWQSYLNCINSFQQPDFQSGMSQGTSIAGSAVSTDRFLYSVRVLYGQIRDKDREKGKIEDLKITEESMFEIWHKIGEALHELGFFKQP